MFFSAAESKVFFVEFCSYANLSAPNRPLLVHPPLRSDAGIRREEPRGLHDGDAAGAEDEEGLDAHGTKAVGPLRGR